jgi:hypothetical protein
VDVDKISRISNRTGIESLLGHGYRKSKHQVPKN